MAAVVAAVALRAVEELAEVAAARVPVVAAPAPEEAAVPAAVLAVSRAAEGVAVVAEQVEA